MRVINKLRLLWFALLMAATAIPCSVDTSPRFIAIHYPEQIDKQFIKGNLGILTLTLHKRYELIAWRYLSGLPLTTEEQAAFTQPAAAQSPSAVEQWQTARGMRTFLNPTKSSQVAPNTYYVNCLDDSFFTAAHTLADRRIKYANPALLDAWEQAQDQVFTNCSGDKPVYPAPPDPTLPALARADRFYQIAAAHFYAEDFDEALRLFQTIETDRTSPWQTTAQYMTARVLLRESLLLNRPDAAPAAKTQLALLAKSSAAGRFQNASQRLQSYADSVIDPAAVLTSLSHEFAAHQGAHIVEATDTAAWVMQAQRFAKAYSNPDAPAPFDWLRAFQAHDEPYALKRWKDTHSTLWLVPAIMYAEAANPDVPALLEAAAKIPTTSPAYDTVTHHAIRLTTERGDAATARTMLDKLLAGPPSALASVNNSLRAQRMNLATSFDDFLRWAPRRPIGISEDDYDSDSHDDSPVLDRDSIAQLNLTTPVNKLEDAAESPRLPPWIATSIARVAFTRALVLEDNATAMRMLPALTRAFPAWTGDLKTWSTAQGEAKRFAAALLIARHSETDVDLYPDFRARSGNPLAEGHWWCGVDTPSHAIPPDPLSKQIMSEDELKQAAAQLTRLADAGPTQAFLAPTIMSWAQSHPNDPSVPEALHRLVAITRYGCRGIPEINGPISKAAFDLLHSKYPSSDWAKQTPYWFKD